MTDAVIYLAWIAVLVMFFLGRGSRMSRDHWLSVTVLVALGCALVGLVLLFAHALYVLTGGQ